MERSFEVKGDPRLDLSDDDYQSQFEFIKSINDKVSESHQAIIEMRQIKEQLKKYEDLLSEDKEVVAEIATIDSTLYAIETALYQTKNQSRQDPLNFPIRLTNKLAHLNSLTQVGNYPPTVQAIEVRDVLTAEIDALLSQYNTVKTVSIPALNQLIRSKEVDYILIKEED